MDEEFVRLRRDLDSLGYFETLSVQSVSLVKNLVEDLKTTTENLQKYIKLAQNSINEKDSLELSLAPLKEDNAKLIKECNELHKTLLNYRNQTDKELKDLRDRVLKLTEENRELSFDNDKLRINLHETELDLMKSSTITGRKQTQGAKKANNNKTAHFTDENLVRENLQIRYELDKLKRELEDRCKCRDQELSSPNETIKKRLTVHNKQLEEENVKLKNELQDLTKDKNDMEKAYKDCLAKQHEAMKRAIHLAERNKQLETELKDIDRIAIAVEEECNDTVKLKSQKLSKVEMALKDALIEIQTLEKTVTCLKKEIKELEVNNDILLTEKNRMQNVAEDAIRQKKNISDQYNNLKLIEHDLNMEIDVLMQENALNKRIIAEMESKLIIAKSGMGPGGDHGMIVASALVEGKKPTKNPKKKGSKPKKAKNEKGPKRNSKGQQANLKSEKKNNVLDEKETQTSQVPKNSPTNVDLSDDIEDLFLPSDQHKVRLSLKPDIPSGFLRKAKSTESGQLRKKQLSGFSQVDSTTSMHPSIHPYSLDAEEEDIEPACTCSHPKKPACSCNEVETREICCTEKETLTDAFRDGCVQDNMCIQHFQYLLAKEIDECQCELKRSLMRVTKERDHYMDLYIKLANQPQCQCQEEIQTDGLNGCGMCCKVQQIVNFLKQENSMLSKEKMNLMEKLEKNSRENEFSGRCSKTSCKRIQRERDLLKADLGRLEEECDSLRENLKTISEAKRIEHETMTHQIHEYDQLLRKTERERGEFIQACTCMNKSAQITQMEEKIEFLNKLLKANQEDLKNQQILYSQLKTLHEQTDRAHRESQAQLAQLEKELCSAYQTIETLQIPQEQRCVCAGTDLNTLKRQLNKMDMEKDDLLNIVDVKTEEIARLQADLRCKCDIINNLKAEAGDLKYRLGDVSDRASCSGRLLREHENEVHRLQKMLDTAIKCRDNAYDLNRKLENDLAAVSREANLTKHQLMKSQDEIENLKLQSQQYISEVKRAEDLINAKEKEREELLNQFKQLCEQTNHLQSSNSALENEASQSKVQLSVAMDHLNNLEQKGETFEILMSDYEKQIGNLTSQIAKLESERNRFEIYQERTEAELKTMRELCMKLDKEKEQLRFKLLDNEESGNKMSEIQRRNDALSMKLTDSATKLRNAEQLLSDARRENVELNLKDEEARQEILKLTKRIIDMENKLKSALKDVDAYQEKALEYSNQIRDLRRQLTNERFYCTCKNCDVQCTLSGAVCKDKCLDLSRNKKVIVNRFDDNLGIISDESSGRSNQVSPQPKTVTIKRPVEKKQEKASESEVSDESKELLPEKSSSSGIKKISSISLNQQLDEMSGIGKSSGESSEVSGRSTTPTPPPPAPGVNRRTSIPPDRQQNVMNVRRLSTSVTPDQQENRTNERRLSKNLKSDQQENGENERRISDNLKDDQQENGENVRRHSTNSKADQQENEKNKRRLSNDLTDDHHENRTNGRRLSTDSPEKSRKISSPPKDKRKRPSIPQDFNKPKKSSNDAVIASAQIIIRDQEDRQTFEINLNSQPGTPSDSSELKICICETEDEEKVRKKSTKHVKIPSKKPPKSPEKLECFCSPEPSSLCKREPETLKKSTDCRKELDKLKETLAKALVGRPPPNIYNVYNKRDRCYPDCKLFDPLKKACAISRAVKQAKKDSEKE